MTTVQTIDLSGTKRDRLAMRIEVAQTLLDRAGLSAAMGFGDQAAAEIAQAQMVLRGEARLLVDDEGGVSVQTSGAPDG